MDGVKNDMVALFGMGDYLSEFDALSIIYDSDYSDAVQEKLSYAFTVISKVGYKAYCNMELALLEKLCIEDLCNYRPTFSGILIAGYDSYPTILISS